MELRNKNLALLSLKVDNILLIFSSAILGISANSQALGVLEGHEENTPLQLVSQLEEGTLNSPLDITPVDWNGIKSQARLSISCWRL